MGLGVTTMNIKRWLTVGIVCGMALSARILVRATPNAFRYAFVTSEDGARPAKPIIISSIDPDSPGELAPLYTVPVPDDGGPNALSFRKALSSPDGNWIALIFWAWGVGIQEAEIEIVKAATGEVLRVTDYPINIYDNDESTLERIPLAVWSPDSRYLAFDALKLDGKLWHSVPFEGDLYERPFESAVFVYSMEKRQIINPAGYGSGWTTWYTWSADSTQIASASVKDLRVWLETHSITGKAPIGPIDIEYAQSLPNGLCYLRWSPDARYLSFVSDCDYSYLSFYKEVYVIELTTRKITQVTNYSQQLGPSPDNWASSYPEPVWFDSNTLLVGAGAWRGQGVSAHIEETALYRWTTNNKIVLAKTWTTDWTQNPISREFAYLTLKYTLDSALINGYSTIDTLNIGAIQGDKLVTKLELSSTGCTPMWSPDGRILACSQNQGTRAIFQPDGDRTVSYAWETMFVNIETNRITQYMPPIEKDGATIAVVGWIRLP